MKKVGRPRLPASKLSTWGVYKRHSREKSPGAGRNMVRHHVAGDKKYGTKVVLISRSRHAAIHNKRRKSYLS